MLPSEALPHAAKGRYELLFVLAEREALRGGRNMKSKLSTDVARPPSQRMVRRRTCELYVVEKIEAYNVAIEALQNHEPADGDPTGIARKLRRALAEKLDREIQKWCEGAVLTETPKATPRVVKKHYEKHDRP